MVYDVTDKQSFEDIEDYWLRDIMVNCPEGVKLSLIGNKADMGSKR
jgi:GTPase SAR1 family protein